MKKVTAQFAAVFVGVLLLHLAGATALMNSAKTEEAPHLATSVDPYYHSSSEEREPAPVPAGQPESGDPPGSLPDSFAAKSDTAGAPIASPPIPASAVTAAAAARDAESPPKRKKPGTDPSARRLTVTQLLAPDPHPAPETGAAKADAGSPGPAAKTPKVKPLPADKSSSGLRKIRSLSGN